MSTGANIYQMYGKCSSKERIDLIYTNYSQFEGIIKGCEAKLIYEIEAEQEYNRQSRKGDLGVRIQNIGHYSDKTANQAVAYVMLEQEVDLDELSDSALKDVVNKTEFIQKHRVLRMMRMEYRCFNGQLQMLSRENQKIILPYLRHEKNTWNVAEELQVPFETAKKRIYRIRKQIVTGLLDEFVEKL